MSDNALITRISHGDQVAMRQLMQRYNQTLYRTARSILKDEDEAEDAVQDAYIHAFQSLSKFRQESRLSTWLVRIVVNEALGRLRKKVRQAEIIKLVEDLPQRSSNYHNGEDIGDAMDTSELPDEVIFRAQIRQLIEAKIDQLPEVFRPVFVLRAIEEMSVEETAACLGLPPATVRSRFFRARGLLRESLARDVDLSIEAAFSFAGDRCERIVAGVMEKWKKVEHHFI
ncbi:MAG: RNA polymerase sigma factor [Acinetobacter sp.]